MKYIIDTDPGIDDAIGIVMAHLYKLDIIGYTLVSGNVKLESVERNIKILQDFMQTNTKMYTGRQGIYINKTAEYAHGKYGLGDVLYPKSRLKIERMRAENFLIKASKKYKGNLTIICFGPLTNIANAIKKDKNFYKRVNLVIMAASYNPTALVPYRDFNNVANPKAAKLVFETPFENIKVVTHDCGIKAIIDKEYINSLENSDKFLSKFISQVSQKYMEFNKIHYGIEGITAPDPLTVASIINKDVVTFEKAKIKIMLSKERRGESVVKLGAGNILISTDINLKLFEKVFKDVFN